MTVGGEVVFVGDGDLLPSACTTDSLVVWLPFNCPVGRITFFAAAFYELAAAVLGGNYVADTESYGRRHRKRPCVARKVNLEKP